MKFLNKFTNNRVWHLFAETAHCSLLAEGVVFGLHIRRKMLQQILAGIKLQALTKKFERFGIMVV